MTALESSSATPAPPASAGGAGTFPRPPRRKGFSLLTAGDKITLAVMVGIPTALVIGLIIIPTLASVILSFTSWNGIGGLNEIVFIGFKNYADLANLYQPFWPAVSHGRRQGD